MVSGAAGPRGCGLQSQQCLAFPRRGRTCLSLASSTAGMWRGTPSCGNGDRQSWGEAGQGDAAHP